MDLDRLFFPRSIAVVGASSKFFGGKVPFYQILQISGYPGPLYPVNPAYKELKGAMVYPSLEAVPEGVDLAVCTVPARLALETVEIAVKKDIGFVHFFTSGFSEAGNRDLEAALLKAARKGKTRIVGPNCLGVYCSQAKVTFDPMVKTEGVGTTAFMGQSGGVVNNIMRMANARLIKINKAVSYGNQIDLRVEDFLEYFARDDTIRAVAAYIEDIKNPRAFLDVLSRITRDKPVIILKGGTTEQGALAAASHTGALAGHHAVWSAAMRQHRCIEVQTQRQLVDTLALATSARIPRGKRLGYLGAGGGTSVLFTDLATSAGFFIPELQKKTRDLIAEKIPDVNTSTRNPVDLGAFGFNHPVMTHSLKAIDQDENIDVIIMYLTLDLMDTFNRKEVEEGLRAIASEAGARSKPVVPILARAREDVTHLEELRLLALSFFHEAGMPVYNSLQESVNAIRCIQQWSGKDFRPPVSGP